MTPDPGFFLIQLTDTLAALIGDVDVFRHQATLSESQGQRFDIILKHLHRACDHAEAGQPTPDNLDFVAVLDDNMDAINAQADEIKTLVAEMRAQCDAWVVRMNQGEKDE